QRKQTDRFAFTERRLAALNRPTLGAVYIYDTVTKGPCVRLTPTKAMYVFYIWYAGRPQRLTLGEVGQVQLRQIRQIVAVLSGELAHGVDVFARGKQKKRADAPVTPDAAFQRHLVHDLTCATAPGGTRRACGGGCRRG